MTGAGHPPGTSERDPVRDPREPVAPLLRDLRARTEGLAAAVLALVARTPAPALAIAELGNGMEFGPIERSLVPFRSGRSGARVTVVMFEPGGTMTRDRRKARPEESRFGISFDQAQPLDDTLTSGPLRVLAIAIDTTLVISVDGELDISTAPVLGAGFERALDEHVVEEVVLDVENLAFIDCGGLDGLLACTALARDRHIPVGLAGTSRALDRLLSYTGTQLGRPCLPVT